ncbi:hypothetical protein [Lapidilactobacillus gannanensis]|uniref:Uncharacterized protein n=1 Tax=Lapidilactobacillus gannanensis TaxID=2486002 RepID=A0ABW4BKK3_9LACO|nr:hypothetical protein [Lapidilactobacillus gannanensis]
MTREEMIDDMIQWRPDVPRSHWESKSIQVVEANWKLLNNCESNEADEINATYC